MVHNPVDKYFGRTVT